MSLESMISGNPLLAGVAISAASFAVATTVVVAVNECGNFADGRKLKKLNALANAGQPAPAETAK